MDKLKIPILIFLIISFILALVLQFMGWYSHSLSEKGEVNTEVEVIYYLHYYKNTKVTSSGHTTEKTVFEKDYSQQEEFCTLCLENIWCNAQCGLYHILEPISLLNIVTIAGLAISGLITSLLIVFERKRYFNGNLFNILYWFLILQTAVCSVLFLIFDILSLTKWTHLKNSQPVRSYQNNSIIIPIIGIINSVLILISCILCSFSYHNFRKPKDILNSRRESFL